MLHKPIVIRIRPASRRPNKVLARIILVVLVLLATLVSVPILHGLGGR